MLQVIKAGIVAVKMAMSEQVLFKSDKGSGFLPTTKAFAAMWWFTLLFYVLAVLVATTIGVRRSTAVTTPGNRISTMAIRTTTTRTTQTGFVQFGVLSKT